MASNSPFSFSGTLNLSSVLTRSSTNDLLRAELERSRLIGAKAVHCVACLSYVFNHHQRDLAERLTSLQHAQHDLVISTMRAHLDHEHCLETVLPLCNELLDDLRYRLPRERFSPLDRSAADQPISLGARLSSLFAVTSSRSMRMNSARSRLGSGSSMRDCARSTAGTVCSSNARPSSVRVS